MCGMFGGQINCTYIRDQYMRKREWDKLHCYAYARWERTRDMQKARFWVKMMQRIEQRRPR